VDATADDETIRALGYQWGWQFSYPDANVTTRNELVIPANESVTIRLRSADVLHALFVPRLGVKKDAFPGEEDHRAHERHAGRHLQSRLY
jgi:cytochrome c oxidase subunit 2